MTDYQAIERMDHSRVNALRRSFGPGSIPDGGSVEEPMLGGRP